MKLSRVSKEGECRESYCSREEGITSRFTSSVNEYCQVDCRYRHREKEKERDRERVEHTCECGWRRW